jgi:hypothetical protein
MLNSQITGFPLVPWETSTSGNSKMKIADLNAMLYLPLLNNYKKKASALTMSLTTDMKKSLVEIKPS